MNEWKMRTEAIIIVADGNYVASTTELQDLEKEKKSVQGARCSKSFIFLSRLSLTLCSSFPTRCQAILTLKMNGIINNWWFAPNERARIIFERYTTRFFSSISTYSRLLVFVSTSVVFFLNWFSACFCDFLIFFSARKRKSSMKSRFPACVVNIVNPHVEFGKLICDF